jgi:16S rRNA (uracil1498-N3)-methyltransferase
MADRFFVPHPLGVGEAVLSGAEAHHLSTVRRFLPGERVTLFTGDGNEYPAEILAIEKKQVVVTVLAVVKVDREIGFRLEVAAAMPKGNRGDFLVEKLTELGVTRFIPLVTARTIVQPRESRLENLRRAVIEASKQCGRNVLMHVDPPISWAELMQATDHPKRKLILTPSPSFLNRAEGQGEKASHSKQIDTTATIYSAFPHEEKKWEVIVAVGPEGGFTDEEITTAIAAGWQRTTLGPRILRVETAAIAAAAIFSNPFAASFAKLP